MSAVSIIHTEHDEAFGEKVAAALSREGHRAKRHRVDPLSGDLDLDESVAIVIWSKAAAKLARIHDQAREALARGALIPVAVGGAAAPRGFEELPAVDLSGWSGDDNDPRWRFVLDEINLGARRDMLEDGAVWAPPLPAGHETTRPSIGAEGDWPPEDDDSENYATLEDRLEDDAIIAPLEFEPTTGFRPLHVAIGASIGLFALTAGAVFLAPVLLSAPPRIAAPAPPRASAEETPATLAFVEPIDTESVMQSAPREEAANANETDTPAPENTDAAANKASADAGAQAEIESISIRSAYPAKDEITPPPIAPPADIPADNPSNIPAKRPGGGAIADNGDAMENLVAAVTAEAAADITDPADPAPLSEEVAEGADLGEYFRDCLDCPDMAVLPAGWFSMGSPPHEPARHISEGPVVETVITRPFAIGAREVTFEQWDACVAEGGCKGYAPWDHGWGRDDRPVIGVSFEDAEAFAAWLSAKTGQAYRLPSEAEWEYAARAGSATRFSFGNSVSPSQANFNGAHAYGAPEGVNRRRTTPVASFSPNAFGLFDMHGNAWEWTADCWTQDHSDAAGNGPPQGSDCSLRVLKGGAWNTGGWRLRAAHRIGKAPTAREYDNGFRVARDID